MNRTLYALGVLLFAATTHANELYGDNTDPRFFNINNSTSLSVSFTSLLFGLFSLLALGLLAAVLSFFLFGSGEETGYSGGSSYSSYGSGRAAYVYMHYIDNMACWWRAYGQKGTLTDNSMLVHVLLFALVACAAAVEDTVSLQDGAPDPRFFFIGNTTGLTINLSSILASAVAGLAGLLLLAGLAYLLYLLSSGGDETGYSSYSGYGSSPHSSGYSARSASADSPYSAIWDNLSVLDWIAMMEEVYRKFDATKMECQQRLVCELHQNESTWGSTARQMNDAFGYLTYLELLNLPAELDAVLKQYLEAANKGRSSQKTCEDLYSGCEFSMKTLINKYNGSNSI